MFASISVAAPLIEDLHENHFLTVVTRAQVICKLVEPF